VLIGAGVVVVLLREVWVMQINRVWDMLDCKPALYCRDNNIVSWACGLHRHMHKFAGAISRYVSVSITQRPMGQY